MPARMPREHGRYVALVILAAVWQGMIGVFAKWISWPPLPIVCLRCVFATGMLWLVLALRPRRSSDGEPGTILTNWRVLLGSGVLLAVHWGTLFWAYKVAPVGPVVVAVFTYPLLASVVEPFCFGGRPVARQVWAAVLGLVGVTLITLQGGMDESAGQLRLGVTLGLISAACFALRGIYSRKLLQKTDAITIMAVQTTVVAVLFAPTLIQVSAPLVSVRELALLGILGVAFTALPHTVNVWALRHLSVAASGIIGSLQVLSGIALSVVLLGERAPLVVWIGAGLVVLAVAWESTAASPGAK